MTVPLHNVFWTCLHGPHAALSLGTNRARRYAPGYWPMLGFADPNVPDFDALAPHCAPGEEFFCTDWTGAVPDGWLLKFEGPMVRMVWEGEMPNADPLVSVRLGAAHASQAMALATLAKPGPFGPRALEVGEFHGCFEGDTLVAMAGERLQATGAREISGVCTHPDHRGRGLAQRLTAQQMRRQMLRGERPFLHALRDNTAAVTLYQRMGWRIAAEPVVRVVERRAPG